MTIHDDIVSPRLILRLASAEALTATVAGNLGAVSDELGLAVPSGWAEVAPLARRRLNQLAEDPAYYPWSIRAIALPETRNVIGYVNFHAAPGSVNLQHHSPRAVEFGYTILPDHRRQGYATEVVEALIGWAKQRGADTFVFSISPDNTPSLALARRLGAAKVGTQIDEEDGPEDVYLLRQ